ncbi:hypothetical protein IMZ48_12505 [Candidatus Bathyarchaeota archaeon]|nr:hypothetical protein [Candidatus Bathyarchaeota archaeon]
MDQQWSALVANLPYPAAKFSGSEVEHRWNKEFWGETLGKNEVIVCTAAILQKCLAQGFITMSRISLLIFDEAHHAKKNHPYARIIKDYFLRQSDLNGRPRILGMTASPVDGKANVQAAAEELEYLLCSDIATVSSGRLTEEFGQKVHEEIMIPFPRLERRIDTDLMRKIRSLLEATPLYEKMVKYSSSCTSELGPWCMDRFWKLCFSSPRMPSVVANAENFAQQRRRTIDFCREDQNPVRIVNKVHEIIEEHALPALNPDTSHLSHKTLLLVSVLGDYFREPGEHKCIVFVEKRYTAMLLAEVFKQLQSLPYLKPAYVVGERADQGPVTMSYREAVLTIHRFRKGETNCLFASPVAEEGIDIPDCDIVIRFDLCNSMIQYIQSRGRARHEKSKFIILYEKDNWEHIKRLAQTSNDAAVLRRFCSMLPGDRRLDSDQESRQNLHNYSAQPSCTVRSSGAKLTFTDSLQVLASFVSSFQERGQANLVPEYVVMNIGSEYVAQVILPDKSPIQTKRGDPQLSKHAAKCSAAFELCQDLIRKDYIDEHLQPIFKKKLGPAMGNARLAISSNKKSQYNMLLKPVVWSHVGPPEKLYCTAITLENPAALGRASCPLLLLTRDPLPRLPGIPLFFGEDDKSIVHQTQLSGPLGVGKDEKGGTKTLEDLRVFTLRIFEDVFSKNFEATADELPYFLAPSCKGHDSDFSQTAPRDAIDWDAVKTVTQNEGLVPGVGDDPEVFYKDRFVADPWDGGRKLYSVRVRGDLRPSDPVPKGVPAPLYRHWKTVEHNIREYSVSMWSRTRAARVWKDDQPVVEAKLVSLRRNLLDDFDEDRKAVKTCFVIMEPLRVSAVSVVPRHLKTKLTEAAFHARGCDGLRVSGHYPPNRRESYRAGCV